MNEDRGLRLTLYLTDVPELMEVPWEFLPRGDGFSLTVDFHARGALARSQEVRRPRKLTLPLRILGMVSGPSGVEKLDVDMERAKLSEALSDLEHSGMVELRWLERATLSELNDAMSAPDDVHALHYIGHGAYDKRTEGGILVLENAHGAAHEVTGEELGSLLQDEHSLRLVVLNSCEGAEGIARRPLLRGRCEPRQTQHPSRDRDAVRNHGRGGDHVRRPPLHRDRPGPPRRRRARPISQGDLRRRPRHRVRHARAFLRAADAQLFDLQPSQTAPTERPSPKPRLTRPPPRDPRLTGATGLASFCASSTRRMAFGDADVATSPAWRSARTGGGSPPPVPTRPRAYGTSTMASNSATSPMTTGWSA